MSEISEEEFDIEVEGEETPDIEIIDTTPEKDKGKALLSAADEELDPPDEDELASYSDRVQKRIKDATFRFHDQRRKREAAERERTEATKFAQETLKKSQQLEAALYQYEAGFVDQAKTRVDVELSQAQSEMKAAFEVGDADKLAAAQARIAKLAVQQDQYSRFTPREVPEEQVYQPVPQSGPSDDDAKRFVSWREKNDWFDSDETLRDFAMGLHARIATSDPSIVGTEEYYAEIEQKVKQTFPAKFQKPGVVPRTQNSNQPVAGVSRSSGSEKSRKTITLTKEQMNLCRTLGIPPQEYVKQMMKTEA